MSNDNQSPASTRRQYQITTNDLPLSCPMPNMRLWDAHPRVFLPIEETGHAVCPYCEAEYFLEGFNREDVRIEAKKKDF